MMVDPLPILKALADESRLRIVSVLHQGTFNVQEITSILELSQPTVSHHLKILQQASVVSQTKQGTWAYYSLPNETARSNDAERVPRQIVESLLQSLEVNGNADLRPYAEDRTRIQSVINKRRDLSKSYFESVAPKWNQLREEEISDSGPLHELVSLITPDLDLADLGCGSGALLELILPRKGATIAVDYSQSMLDEAARNLGDKKSKVDLRLGYLEHLPLADQSIDIAVAHMVLHHLAEPIKALNDIRRVLRKNGRCLIVDWSEHSREYMRERFADLWLGFNTKEITNWAKSAGFSKADFKFFGDNKEIFLLALS